MSEKNNSGQFQSGNEIGMETRFKKKNRAAVKYRDEYCQMLLDYFTLQERQIIYEKKYYKDGTLQCETPKFILPPRLPTFELFAAKIGVVPNTLLNWCEKYPRFADAYALAKSMQLGIAKQGGAMKDYDGNFTKFLLVNDHGMSDKTTQEQTQDKPFEVNIRVIGKPQD